MAWGLPNALYPLVFDPLEGQWLAPPERGSATAMSTLMVAPVLMLLIAAGRLSAVVRDERLISLLLIGVSKSRTLLAAVVENVALAALGATAGVGLLLAGGWLVDTVLPVAQPFHLTAAQTIAVAVGVVVLSGALALASVRTLSAAPTQSRRGGVARPASWWRLVPLVLSIACFAVLISNPSMDGGLMASLFLGGVATGAVAIATTPALIARYSAVLLRRSRRLTLTIAGRGIEADPTSATRRVAAVGVGIFVIIIAAGVMNAWESVPQSRYATLAAERGPQEVTVLPWTPMGEPTTITPDDVAAFAALPQVTRVVPDLGLTPVGCDEEGGWESCFGTFVGTCDELAAYLPITGCSDNHAAWLDATDKALGFVDDRPRPAVLDLHHPPSDEDDHETTSFAVNLTSPPIQADWRAAAITRGHLPDVDVFVPRHLVSGGGLPISSLDVIGPPGRDFANAVAQLADQRGLQAPAWHYSDYEMLLSVRTMLGSAGAALVAVVVLIVTLSTLDWLRESRAPRMRMFVAGMPRRIIARAYIAQFAAPVIGAALLGAGLGLAGLRAYEVLGQDATVGVLQLPPTYWWLVGSLVAGSVVATGIAGLAARERVRPADLRRE